MSEKTSLNNSGSRGCETNDRELNARPWRSFSVCRANLAIFKFLENLRNRKKNLEMEICLF